MIRTEKLFQLIPHTDTRIEHSGVGYLAISYDPL